MNPLNLTHRLIIYLTSFALVAEFVLFIWKTPAQISTATFFLSTLQGDTVVVTEYTDNSDTNPGDGICDAYIVAGDQCTLRAAIEELNAQGPDVTPHVIEFNISGTGPFTIAPASALPNITVPVEIRGETQPGTTCPAANTPATLLIVLDGINAGADVDGLLLDSGSDGSTIRGLVIGNFTGDGIRIVSNDNRVRCNHVGVSADGVSEIGNDTNGIFVAGDGNSIGGSTSPVQRNVISGNEAVGVRIDSSAENNVVVNNYIGTTADGMGDLGNSSGMYVNAHNSMIGGTNALARNVISGNSSYGIRVNTGENNIIQGNYIGVARDGTTPLPNLSNGIELLGTATSNIVGGTASGEANRIVNNGSYGVTVDENVTGVPVQNEIRGNSIFNNGNLGIDLGEDGVDTNDPGDADGGENEHQNYPVLSLAPGSTILTGTLDSQANTQYTLDLYRSSSCDSSGYGEGQQHLFTEVVTTDGSGHLEITGDLTGTVSPGNGITATATDPNGNTSEFSACVTVTSPVTPTPTPTQTGTPGPSPTPTTTSTPGPSPTATATVTPGPSPTPTTTPTAGPSPTATPTLDYAVYLPFIRK